MLSQGLISREEVQFAGPTHEKILIYEFGGFRIDPRQRLLVRNGETIVLTPKAFDTLLFLVQNSGRILEKDTLMKALWPESFVEEGNLTQNIFILRKTLGEDQDGNRFIETIPKIGYQFVAPVQEIDASVLREFRSNETGSASGAGDKLPAPDTLSDQPPAETSAQKESWSQHSPFRGLHAFETEDSWLFFGREPETEDLLGRLHQSPVLAVVGDSGTGKSSLIRGGLIPALGRAHLQPKNAAGELWRIALFRPSSSPFDYLAETLPGQLAPELKLKERSEFIADCRDKFPSGRDALRNAITALVNVADLTMEQARRTHILLVVDQFEELFTLTSSQEIRDQYIDSLLAASRFDGVIPVHLVLVVRSDFYLRCVEHAALSHCLAGNLYNIPQMSASQSRESIERRLALANVSAEPGLLDSLLEDVGTEPAKLALLEHTLDELWEKCGGSGGTLTHRAYTEIGRLRGPLGRHASHIYQGILDENRKKLVQKIFLELIQTEEGMQDTRRRVHKEHLFSLGEPQEIEQLLVDLASSRLITTGREGDRTFVEVSHEMLLRGWDLLQGWIRENREELQRERRLYQAAKDWQMFGREDAALLRGTRLQQGEEWLLRHPQAHSLLREFLQAGIAAHAEAKERELEKQRAAATRLRWVLGASAGLLLVILGGQSDWVLHLVYKVRALVCGGPLLQAVHWFPTLGFGALTGILLWRRLARGLPFFFGFVLIAWVKNAACLVAYHINPGAGSSLAYFYTYWISHLGAAVCASLATCELALDRFPPRLYRLAFYSCLFPVVALICIFLGFPGVFSGVSLPPAAKAISVFDVLQILGLLLFLGLMMLAGRRSARPEFTIALGLGINAVAFLILFVVSLKSGPLSITSELLPVAEAVTCVIWLVSFSRPKISASLPNKRPWRFRRYRG